MLVVVAGRVTFLLLRLTVIEIDLSLVSLVKLYLLLGVIGASIRLVGCLPQTLLGVSRKNQNVLICLGFDHFLIDFALIFHWLTLLFKQL